MRKESKSDKYLAALKDVDNIVIIEKTRGKIDELKTKNARAALAWHLKYSWKVKYGSWSVRDDKGKFAGITVRIAR